MTGSRELEHSGLKPVYTIGSVAGLAAIVACVILLADDQDKVFWGNISIGASVALSIGAGALLLSRGRMMVGSERRAHAVLFAALVLWLTAWLLWSYYEIILEAALFPSPADALWLVGYGLSIYYVAWSYRSASSRLLEPRLISLFLATIITSVIVAIFLFPIINYALNAGGDGLTLFIGISYPILDGVLLAMAILTLVSLRRPSQQQQQQQLHRIIPSAMIMSALLAGVIADTGFGYGAATGAPLLEERVWDILYSIAYLCIAGALYWQYRLHSIHSKEDKLS